MTTLAGFKTAVDIDLLAWAWYDECLATRPPDDSFVIR